jgi:hypothetical protein
MFKCFVEEVHALECRLIVNIHQGTLFPLIQHFHITDTHNEINCCMFMCRSGLNWKILG